MSEIEYQESYAALESRNKSLQSRLDAAEKVINAIEDASALEMDSTLSAGGALESIDEALAKYKEGEE